MHLDLTGVFDTLRAYWVPRVDKTAHPTIEVA